MQTLVLNFLMVLKHMNCLLNVIIKQNSEISWLDIWKKAESRSVETTYDKKSDEGSNSVRMRHENSGASKVVQK